MCGTCWICRARLRTFSHWCLSWRLGSRLCSGFIVTKVCNWFKLSWLGLFISFLFPNWLLNRLLHHLLLLLLRLILLRLLISLLWLTHLLLRSLLNRLWTVNGRLSWLSSLRLSLRISSLWLLLLRLLLSLLLLYNSFDIKGGLGLLNLWDVICKNIFMRLINPVPYDRKL